MFTSHHFRVQETTEQFFSMTAEGIRSKERYEER